VIAPLASSTAATTLGSESGKRADMKAAAEAFEAVFLRQMIGSMRQAKLSEDALFGNSAGEQFRDMSDAKVAEEMAEGGGFGIAELLLKQFDQRGDGT
jgi:peptidoglycan hydrolase FlgJ